MRDLKKKFFGGFNALAIGGKNVIQFTLYFLFNLFRESTFFFHCTHLLPGLCSFIFSFYHYVLFCHVFGSEN